MAEQPKIAIIGAGLAGLTLARALEGAAAVTVFEKSRGFGGRMSTRRAAPYAFDHGAQYFKAKGEGFGAFLAPFIEAGHVARWSPRMVRLEADGAAVPVAETEPLYVAVPAMNSLCKELGAGLEVALATRVRSLRRDAGQWTLEMQDGGAATGFDWVVSTAPAEQTVALLPDGFSGRSALAGARMSGCFTLMLGLGAGVDLPWDAARIDSGPVAWAAQDATKPGRSGAGSLVLQSANDWAEAHLEDDLAATEAEMQRTFEAVTGRALAPQYHSLHRWRFAAVGTPAGAPYLMDAEAGLAAAGDWCLMGRVEAAYESAAALAAALTARL